MSASVPLEVLDQLVEVLRLLLVGYPRIVQTESEALHRPVFQVAPEEVRHEEGEALEQEEEADPLVIALELDVILLADRVVRSNTYKRKTVIGITRLNDKVISGCCWVIYLVEPAF